MNDYTATLVPDFSYHVYNRAIGSDNLFTQSGNYDFFLQKYKEYILPVADTFCYCLMPNHFHFLIRIKNEKALIKSFSNLSSVNSKEQNDLISKQFSNFFNSYAKAFNKQQRRNGSLFSRPFKRRLVTDEKYLHKLVHYIHHNPVESGFSQTPESWNYSSYKNLISNVPTFLYREEVIGWFDDVENFKYIHQNSPEFTGIE